MRRLDVVRSVVVPLNAVAEICYSQEERSARAGDERNRSPQTDGGGWRRMRMDERGPEKNALPGSGSRCSSGSGKKLNASNEKISERYWIHRSKFSRNSQSTWHVPANRPAAAIAFAAGRRRHPLELHIFQLQIGRSDACPLSIQRRREIALWANVNFGEFFSALSAAPDRSPGLV